MKKILIFLGLFCFVSVNAFSGVQALLRGVTYDEITGKPCQTTLDIFGSKGERTRVKSNSLTGKYETIVNTGGTYTFKFSNFDIYPAEEQVYIKDSSEYFEISKDFIIKHLEEGKLVLKEMVFENGKSNISSSGQDFISELEQKMKLNLSMILTIKVNANDLYKTESKTKVKAKQAKNVKKPDAKAGTKLVDARVIELNSALENSGIFKNRIKVEADYTSPAINSTNTNEKLNFNIMVVSGVVKDIFK